MLPFKRIVFPVDYSAPCAAVVPYVKDMLRQFGAQLSLLHAYGPEALAYSELAITDVELPDEARAAEETRLRQFAQENFPGEHVECFVERGEAGAAVDKLVKHQGADLVMLATHGRGIVRRMLLGSVASKILHDISTAVWTGNGKDLRDHPPALPYRQILCAVNYGVNGNDEAAAVIRAAAALAEVYGAKLSLMHAVETPPAAWDVDFTPYKQEIMDAADFKLRELKKLLDLECPHTVVDASVADGVRDEAVRLKADLIVTGRGHSQGTLSRLWSHLYPIVREAPCPVLSI